MIANAAEPGAASMPGSPVDSLEVGFEVWQPVRVRRRRRVAMAGRCMGGV